MNMKIAFASILALSLGLSTTCFANDIEKLVDKASSSGKKALLKELGKFEQSAINGNTAAKTVAGAANPAGASAATSAAGTAVAGKTPAAPTTPATSAATPATGAAVNVSGATPAAATASGSSGLTNKIQQAATKEGGKLFNKYGSKYLKEGEKQVEKMLK